MRDDGGRLLAALIAELRDFQLAEDCLQEAWASAVIHWQRGLPARRRAGCCRWRAARPSINSAAGKNFREKQRELLILMEHDQADSTEEAHEQCHPR